MRSVLIVVDAGAGTFGATTVVRVHQFAELFQKSSTVRAEFTSRRSTRYGNLRSSLARHWWGSSAGALLGRWEHRVTKRREVSIVKRSREFDYVYLVRTPSWSFHKALWDEGKARIAMDLNDGLWLPFFRRGGYQQLEGMISHSHSIVCENDYLAAFARSFTSNVFVVPDSPQVEKFDAVRARFKPSGDRVTLGWIGSAGTADSLHAIFEPLEELFARNQAIHLRVLGADVGNLPRFEKVRFSCKPVYTNEEMITEALQMDIGLFPLFKTEDSISRGTLKARIYMSAGMVAACQNVGELPKLIGTNVNGVVAGTPQQWTERLEWLIANPTERKALADRALAMIRRDYSRQVCFDRLLPVFLQN